MSRRRFLSSKAAMALFMKSAACQDAVSENRFCDRCDYYREAANHMARVGHDVKALEFLGLIDHPEAKAQGEIEVAISFARIKSKHTASLIHSAQSWVSENSDTEHNFLQEFYSRFSLAHALHGDTAMAMSWAEKALYIPGIIDNDTKIRIYHDVMEAALAIELESLFNSTYEKAIAYIKHELRYGDISTGVYGFEVLSQTIRKSEKGRQYTKLVDFASKHIFRAIDDDAAFDHKHKIGCLIAGGYLLELAQYAAEAGEPTQAFMVYTQALNLWHHPSQKGRPDNCYTPLGTYIPVKKLLYSCALGFARLQNKDGVIATIAMIDDLEYEKKKAAYAHDRYLLSNEILRYDIWRILGDNAKAMKALEKACKLLNIGSSGIVDSDLYDLSKISAGLWLLETSMSTGSQ